MKRALVIGAGMSGRAAARALLRKGFSVDLYDDKGTTAYEHPELKELSVVFLLEPPSNLTYSLAVVSPGVAKEHPLVRRLEQAAVPLTGEIDLGFEALPQKAIGVTGSNGKTTTVMLTAHLLSSIGKHAEAVGNNELPLSDWVEAKSEESIAVVELSSYQLERLSSKKLDAAIILNIYPNHLDRHGSLEAYAEAKFRIKECLKEGGILFAHRQVISAFPELAKRALAVSTDAFLSELQLKHPLTTNEENLLAAYALARIYGLNAEEAINHQKSFQRPPHRMEFVGTFKGVDVYNDSKGTTVEAVSRAVLSLNKPIHLIAGGRGKGAPYTPWKDSFSGRVAALYLIGEDKEVISKTLSELTTTTKYETLDEAVKAAVEAAKAGEVILLSPGCASWDMFSSYRERGDRFKRLILDSYMSSGVMH